MNAKRPIGLKAQQKRKKHRTDHQDDQQTGQNDSQRSSFLSIPLPDNCQKKLTSETDDGLTVEDLIQLKLQADDLIDHPTDRENESEQLANILRGICHESVRQIELLKSSEPHQNNSSSNGNDLKKDEVKIDGDLMNEFYHRLICWATIELGFLIERYSDEPSPRKRIIQQDEPDSLKGWLELSSRLLKNRKVDSEGEDEGMNPKINDRHQDLDRIGSVVSLSSIFDCLRLVEVNFSIFGAKKGSSSDLLESFESFLQSFGENLKRSKSYCLRIIERFLEVLLKKIDPDESQPMIFDKLLTSLHLLRGRSDEENDGDDEESESLKDDEARSIESRVGDLYLTIGTQLAEQLEEQFYCEDDKDDELEEGEEGESFLMPLDDQRYKTSVKALTSAIEVFKKNLNQEAGAGLKDNDNDDKRVEEDGKDDYYEDIRVKLKETYLTLGNLTPPGEKRERLYSLAGL